MTKRMGKSWQLCALVAAAGSTTACTPKARHDVTSTRRALTTSNGFVQNGLTTNGIWGNGIWGNGIWGNGIWGNGIWGNGIWGNGIWGNGIWGNGIWGNGIWGNGLWSSLTWSPELTGDAAIPGNALRNSFYTRQLLQYMYSCAMPATTYDTSLDPNGGSLQCSSPDAGPDAGGCPAGYTCSSEGICVVPLIGGIGLAINDDGTTWWRQPAPGGATDLTTGKWGQCDESCQRWVSACLLARTNAYGVHVQISIRAPADPPPNATPGRQLQFAAVRAALAPDPTSSELADYTNREGAYYGNIFATTPVNGLPAPGYTGPAIGPIANTPTFYACAGPDSNTPEITKRFCSSQGDQSVINVPGVCWPAATDPTSPEKPVCTGLDASDSIFGCHTTAGSTIAGDRYDEVLTVHLRQPIAVCDNGVCEEGEDSPSVPARYCPSDCHPGGWAQTFDHLATGSAGVANVDYSGSSAVSADGKTVALVGANAGATTADISFGGSSVSLPPFTAVVGRFGIDGTPEGTPALVAMKYNRYSVAIDSNENIFVAGFDSNYVPAQGPGPAFSLAKLTPTPDGQTIAGSPVGYGGTDALVPYDGRMVTDSKGDLFVAARYIGQMTFATTPTPTSFTSTGYGPTGWGDATFADLFVVKILPDGSVAWARTLGGDDTDLPLAITVDPSGDLIFTADLGLKTSVVYRLSSSNGDATVLRSGPYPIVEFTTAAADAAGDLYVAGTFFETYDFGPGCGPLTSAPGTASDYYLAKYSPDGTACQWIKRAVVQCLPQAIYCDGGFFGAGDLGFDSEQNVVVGGVLDPMYGAGPISGPGIGNAIDFGAGLFQAYQFKNVFVASYDSGGQFRWAKQVPIVLQGNLRGLNVDASDHVILSGTYTGSMEVDGRVLIDANPEFIDNQYQNTYLASFPEPSALDKSPPIIGVASDPTGTTFSTVPSDIYTEATGPNGAMVFYMPPTAFDGGFAGVTVSCAPPPNTTFPIGTTTVTCTATDPVGNRCANTDPQCTARATFHVTVVDTRAPVFPGTTEIGMQFNAQSLTVSTAADPPAGATQVTCAPSAGPDSIYSLNVNDLDTRRIVCSPEGPTFMETGSIPFSVSEIVALTGNTAGTPIGYPLPVAEDQVDGDVPVSCVPNSGTVFPLGTKTVVCSAADHAGNQSQTTFKVTVVNFGTPCASTADCGGGACVDGVCCNTTAASCGQCQACNVAGSVGTCAPTSGGACDDGNACTTGDTCSAGSCVGGPPPSCDDKNPCTVDTCNPGSGCLNTPGNPGALCRGAANVCDSAETCDGTNAACPAAADHMPPTLNAGTDQTVVGSCSSAPIAFTAPTLANPSCEGGTSVTCPTLPGNGYGAHTVTCTATDAHGNVSAPVSFTVTVLQPLTVRIQPPLSGDNDTVDNVVKCGSTVPNKIRLYACGADVTTTVSVTAKLSVSYKGGGGASVATLVPTSNGVGDANGVMVFDGTYYHYNLDTKGLSPTAGVPAFYQENITVTYNSAPGVIVGSDSIQLDTK
jgi:hypothetical protein